MPTAMGPAARHVSRVASAGARLAAGLAIGTALASGLAIASGFAATAPALAPPAAAAPAAARTAEPATEKVVIQYDCIPNYANWGSVTALYTTVSGVTVPPDPKGSSVALAALERERDHPVADCAYYSGAIGFQGAQKGLHHPA